MCELVETLWIITRDEISLLRSFRVITEPKPSLERVTRNRVTRAQEIGFPRFGTRILAFEDLECRIENLRFKFNCSELERRSYCNFIVFD